MKKLLFVLVAAALCADLYAGPGAGVPKWGRAEFAYKASVRGNPFDVEFSATFTNGEETVTVPGFYDGDGTFIVRFMPCSEGRWTFRTRGSIPGLRHSGEFECTSPEPGIHGPVRADGVHFRYADGTRYYPVGTTSYDWMHVGDDRAAMTVASMKESGFNKLRMLLFLHNLDVEYSVFPFERKADGGWDYSRFNPEYFRYVEKRVEALRAIGVEADMILFHPYDGGRWGFDRMPLDVNLRYLRYVTARLGSFSNIWWSLANEFDGVKNIPAADWDKFAECVSSSDPYGHLLSIHGYTATYYDYWKPWYTHTSIQDQAPVEGPGRASTVRNIYKKPVIFDEVCYEGNSQSRWGCLSGEEMLYRMYEGIAAGTYVTHAECFNTGDREDGTNYLAFGGDFHGESWKRIRFLRGILDDLPNPLGLADSSWDPYTSTAGDGYYLIYLGKRMPSEWKFELPVKNALYARPAAGQKFKVEIIDTWEMTVRECPVTFETGEPGRYRISDREGRSVPLPSRPYIMLRIKRI